MSDDHEYALCTREEHAGSLELASTSPEGYWHKLKGPCKCGAQHGATITPLNPPKTTAVKKRSETSARRELVATYSYQDERGRLAYQVMRYADKGFNQRRPVNGEWVYKLDGVTRIPYRLPELLRASLDTTVYIVEGEKDADNLSNKGLIATTSSGGAGNWQESCNPYFQGRRVVILPDNDEKGKEHGEDVAKHLQEITKEVRIINLPNLPDKGDVSDWLAAGGTREQLERMTMPHKRKFLYASEVEIEPVEWLWQRRIARGMGTLLIGDPGLGKSMALTKIASAVTTGGMLPDNHKIEPGGVIIMSPEESDSHTIVPRLVAAGADLSKVILLSKVTERDKDGNEYERPISFPDDASILEEAMIDCKASLAIIDPVLSMIDGKYDTHKDQAVRLALMRVMTVAEKQNCAIVGVMHLNKTSAGNPLYRSGASIAFIALFRIGLFVVPDPDNEMGGVIVNHKNNLASKVKTASLRYSFHENPSEIGYIEWEGASPYTQDQLLNQATPTNNPKSEQETELIEVLKENGMAMTPVEVYEKLNTGQSLNALEQMLKRKLEQGILIRPSRGLYTYNGNSLYTPKPKESISDVSNVSNVSSQSPISNVRTSYIADTDMSVLGDDSNTAPDVALEQTDITDMVFDVSFTDETAQNGMSQPPCGLDGEEIPHCSTSFDYTMSGNHQQNTDDIGNYDNGGNYWCADCIVHYHFMMQGDMLGYPALYDELVRRPVVEAGADKWWKYARTMGHDKVGKALKYAQSAKER